MNELPRKSDTPTQRQLEAFIYARRSSDRQNEESTAQQIAECKRVAERLGYTVVRIFADEAKTGKNDRRPEFQKMVRAIEAGKCDVVIAYKSNRISRNMLQALTYENRFEKCGVKMVYAKEEFGDNAAGRFALRNMMNLNQFYSENMSEDIKRCLYTYAQDCKVLNGRMPLGYCKGEDGKYHLANDGSVEIVQEIFMLYCSGIKSSAICQALNARGVKTSQGNKFTVGTIEKMIKQEKYIGIYRYGDIRIPGGVPRIIDDETFKKAQERLAEAHRAPAKSWSQTDYLLTGKLFCGHCGSAMVGESGRGRNGETYNYYCCAKKKKDTKLCSKKRIRQDYIEDLIIAFTVNNVLTDKVIDKVAEEAIKLQNNDKRTIIHQQHIQHLEDVNRKIQNIVSAIANGLYSEALKASLESLEEEAKNLSRQIAEERHEKPTFTKEQLVEWMSGFRNGDTKSPKFRKQIVDIFVNAIYLYDDHFTISYHTGERQDVMPYDSAIEAESVVDVSQLSSLGPPNVDSSKQIVVFDGLFVFRVGLSV